MIKQIELKKAMVSLLKSKYLDYKIYGNEVREGYVKPSLFVELHPICVSNETVNRTKNAYYYTITYFQKNISETDNLEKVDEIKQLVGMKLMVNSRYLQTDGFEYDFVGSNRNILQISFRISYHERINRKETNAIAKELHYKTRRT